MSRGTEKEERKAVAQLAVGAFSSHVLTAVRPGLWKCAAPNSWVHGFFVSTMPGAIALYGDTPDALLRVYPCATDQAAVEWLRGAVNSPCYLLEKITAKEAWRVFFAGDALRFLRDLVHDEDSRFIPVLTSAEEIHECCELGREKWAELMFDYCVDDAYDAGDGWGASAWWVVEAFRTFIRLHDASVDAAADQAASA